ncbi:hypothetical protein FKP32DRAFT_649224 [Trametes sanguinea]|nr:hypothetical protein FKP32DRAFT_649224 [Trametes sanguinea]
MGSRFDSQPSRPIHVSLSGNDYSSCYNVASPGSIMYRTSCFCKLDLHPSRETSGRTTSPRTRQFACSPGPAPPSIRLRTRYAERPPHAAIRVLAAEHRPGAGCQALPNPLPDAAEAPRATRRLGGHRIAASRLPADPVLNASFAFHEATIRRMRVVPGRAHARPGSASCPCGAIAKISLPRRREGRPRRARCCADKHTW